MKNQTYREIKDIFFSALSGTVMRMQFKSDETEQVLDYMRMADNDVNGLPLWKCRDIPNPVPVTIHPKQILWIQEVVDNDPCPSDNGYSINDYK